MKNRIQKHSGVYTCGMCGKLTRDTGRDEAPVELCYNCFHKTTCENYCYDFDIRPMPDEVGYDRDKFIAMLKAKEFNDKTIEDFIVTLSGE